MYRDAKERRLYLFKELLKLIDFFFNCMYLLTMKKIKLNLLFIFLILFIISFSGINVSASDLSEEDYSNSDYNAVFDYESSKTNDNSQNGIKKRHHYRRENPLELKNSVFSNNKGVALKDLIVKVSLILLFLIGILAAVKIFLSRNRFDQVGSMFDEFAQKFTGGFSGSLNPQGLKLKQTLMLTPGQSIYLVEVEGKKLLLGGTHQGGVQFLADLTQKSLQKELVFSQTVEDSKDSNNQLTSPFFASTMFSQSELEESNNEKKELVKSEHNESFKTNGNGALHQKQPLKRRTNFRQSLLNEAKSESLLRTK